MLPLSAESTPIRTGESSVAGWRSGYGLLGLLLVLIVAVAVRWTGRMDRPFEQDELVTLKTYTALGYDVSSEGGQAAPRVDLKRIVRGWGRATMNAWDPNHHIPHNLLVTVAQALGGLSERTARLPSMLASIGLAAGVYLYILRRFRSPVLALVLALLAVLDPYFMSYGQTARGYTMVVLMMLGQLVVAEQTEEGSKWWWHVFGGLLAIGVFLNLVTLLILWLVPYYAVLILVAKNRRDWMLQAVGAFAVCGTFTVAELPSFIHAQAKYGVRLASFSELTHDSVVAYLAPGWWAIPAAIGLVGLLVGFVQRDRVSLLALSCLGCTAAYVLATHKIPYNRTFGFLLLFLWIGVARVWKSLPGTWARGLVVAVCCIPLATTIAWGRGGSAGTTYSTAMQVISQKLKAAGEDRNALVLLPWVYGEESRYYLPPRPEILQPSAQRSPAKLYLACEERKGRTEFRTQYVDITTQEWVYWAVPESWKKGSVWQVGAFRLLEIPVKVREGGIVEGEAGEGAVLLWQAADPYFALNRYVRDGMKTGRGYWSLRMSSYQFLNPGLVAVYASTPAEASQASELVRDLQKRAGGKTFSVIPAW